MKKSACHKKTKAETLLDLKGLLDSAFILDLFFFTVKDWQTDRQSCLNKIKTLFLKSPLLIARSSCLREDQDNNSCAGKFDSVLNITQINIEASIDKVISSFGEEQDLLDQILIQPMLENVAMSGVLFTKDPNTGADYYIINYDTEGNTAAVTSGCSESLKTHVIAKSLNTVPHPNYQKLIHLAVELEEKLNNSALDIEFAFDVKNNLYLFQVRSLLLNNIEVNYQQTEILNQIKHRFASLSVSHPYLYGKRTILGIMPDWNPAEIIGIRPKPLALSLYKELITDSTWAYQRDNYGYKNLRSFPLLIDLMGLPYIDVRVSFNSFLPKDLDPVIADKLVNYYLDRLEKEPYLHDKVEFEVVFSCYTFDIHQRTRILKDNDFSDSEIDLIIDSLRNLTNTIIHHDKGLWIHDIEKIEELKQRHEQIFFNESFDELTKIYWLTEDCKRYGTLPFAGLARAGFIAVQLLNSMVAADILSPNQKLTFLNSLNAVSTRMTRDLYTLDREHFLQKYGHLRPGTYDILSPRYDEAPDLYFNWDKIKDGSHAEKEDFTLSLSQMKKVESLLIEHNLEHDIVGLFSFMKAAIEGREYSKFIFTKTLSDTLSLLKSFGKKNNISPYDIAFLDVQDLLKLYTSSWDCIKEVKKSIASGKEKYNITTQIILPPLITKDENIFSYDLPNSRPNFITRKSVTTTVVTDLSDTEKMGNAIIFIPNADPGYDWIFTHNIAGFVTAYGGVNSHMSIRASELGLPAIIGAGEQLYHQWRMANILHIDCMNQRVEVVH